MVKNAFIFYSCLILILILSTVSPIKFGWGILCLASLIGNSIIIQKAIKQKPPQKNLLIIISSLFLLLPLFTIFLIVMLSGVTC